MSILRSNRKTYYDAMDSASGTRSDRTRADFLATSASIRIGQRKLWDDLINYTLIEWGKAPELTDEDGLISPTKVAAYKSCEVAKSMRDFGCPFPTGVIEDGEGGIVFENRRDPLYERLEIEENGSVYLVTFSDCTFLSRERLPRECV